jgi:excisionase family DNA binding protein
MDEILTVDEVAALLKVKPGYIHEKCRTRSQNPIPHYRPGKYLRFRRAAVLEWLESTASNAGKRKAGRR